MAAATSQKKGGWGGLIFAAFVAAIVYAPAFAGIAVVADSGLVMAKKAGKLANLVTELGEHPLPLLGQPRLQVAAHQLALDVQVEHHGWVPLLMGTASSGLVRCCS